MPDDSSPSGRRIERRSLLATIGAVGLGGLAGCGGDGDDATDGGNGGSPGAGDEGEPDAGGGTPTQPDQSTSAAGDGNDGGCPAAPSSYERLPVPPAVNADESAVSVETPVNDDVVTMSPNAVYLDYDPHRINLRVRVLTDTDVDTVFSNPDLEATDEYDLPANARLTKQTEFEGQESVTVYLPRGDGVVVINTKVQTETCLDALGRIHDHMVNSLEVL